MRVFMPAADENVCRVYRDEEGDQIELAPAEIDKATHLIGIALGMEELETLPDHIAGSPFIIRFFEEGFLRIEREDGEGSLRFAWEEGDELITSLHDALAIAVNERTLVKSPRNAYTQRYIDSL